MGDYERDYDLAILIILLLLCWPVGLIYYFTRPMRPRRYYVYPPSTYQAPPSYGGQTVYCTHCGAQAPATASFCPSCGAKLQ